MKEAWKMLFKILERIEKAGGLVTLGELGAELGVEESALRGMLDYLAFKGYIDTVSPGLGRERRCSACGCFPCTASCLFRAGPGARAEEAPERGLTSGAGD